MSDFAIDLEELRGSIRDVLSAEAPSDHIHKVFDSGAATDGRLVETAASLGWAGIGLEEDKGGLGLGLPGLGVLYEELGRVLATLPALTTQAVIEQLALSDQAGASAAIAAMLVGETFAAVALDAAALTLHQGCVSGAIAHVVDAPAARYVLVVLNDAQAALIDLSAAGVQVDPVRLVDATRSAATITLSAAPATLIAPDAAALRRHLWLGIACDSLGGAAAILERTIEYMKVRVQFGQPIGSFQALKHRAANHQLRLELARETVGEAIAVHHGAPEALGLAALAKATVADTYASIADDAVQLHGGIGFTWEQDCHIFLKRARLNQQLFGGSEELLDFAAAQLLECA